MKLNIRFRHFEDVDESALTLKSCEAMIHKKLQFMEKYIMKDSTVDVKVKMQKRIDRNLTNTDNQYYFSVECVLKDGEEKRFSFVDKGLVSTIQNARPVIKENILQAMNKNSKKVSEKRAAAKMMKFQPLMTND